MPAVAILARGTMGAGMAGPPAGGIRAKAGALGATCAPGMPDARIAGGRAAVGSAPAPSIRAGARRRSCTTQAIAALLAVLGPP